MGTFLWPQNVIHLLRKPAAPRSKTTLSYCILTHCSGQVNVLTGLEIPRCLLISQEGVGENNHQGGLLQASGGAWCCERSTLFIPDVALLHQYVNCYFSGLSSKKTASSEKWRVKWKRGAKYSLQNAVRCYRSASKFRKGFMCCEY